MGDCDARVGAGSVCSLRRAWACPARAVICTALATLLAVAPDASVGGWNGERMLRAAAASSQRAEQAARDLRELLTGLPAREMHARLSAVNDYFNRAIEFVDDAVLWGQEDHWSSPIETLTRGAGDCEDYAIAKYFSLVAGGVPVVNLRLVYVRAVLPAVRGETQRSLAHMVLAYYEDKSEDPMILDNLVRQIRRASERADLTPVFSFNSEGLWEGAGVKSAGDPLARLSRWREVVRKARLEGFE